MNEKPKTRQIQDKAIDNLFPCRFLKPAHLIEWGVTEITVTISHLQEEEVTPRPKQTEWKPVLYFLNKHDQPHPQGYLISAKTDKDALKTSTAATMISELAGKKITIRLDSWKSKTVLRIDPAPAA